jgi:alkylhydroperoxidase family enzyme
LIEKEFVMTLYADSTYPVPEDVEAIHARQIEQLGSPGTWGAGEQRLAIVNEARQAGYRAGVIEEPSDTGPIPDMELSDVARRVVHRLAVAPKDMDQAFYEQALEDGLSDAEYVEIVGLIARSTCFDVFARGIDVPLRPLPQQQPGQPSRDRPSPAVVEKAWVPTVPNVPEGGEIAQALFGPWKPYIMRGVSLVPDEYRAHTELEEIQYMPSAHFLEFDYQHHEGLTRPQVEIVAARVSAINECFY